MVARQWRAVLTGKAVVGHADWDMAGKADGDMALTAVAGSGGVANRVRVEVVPTGRWWRLAEWW